MKRCIKRFIAGFSAMIMTIVANLAVYAENVATEEDYSQYATGDLPIKMYCEESEYQSAVYERATYPKAVDLSESPCFPPIEDQGSLESCVPFATTYYQYSNEVNRLNNVTDVKDRVIYSPMWVYNLLASGNNGTYPEAVYKFIRNFGALKLSDFPYDGYSFDCEVPYDMREKQIEALQTTCSKEEKIEVPCESNNILVTSVNSSALSPIKKALNEGHVLVGRTYIYGWKMKTGQDANGDTNCTYWSSRSGGGHTIAIVGYDDRVTCDINGNGIIEDGERGALKVANSWGTDWGNDGYMWVMYDALNSISSIDSTTQKNRVGIFDRENESINLFYTISAKKSHENIIGEIELSSESRADLHYAVRLRIDDNNIAYPNITNADDNDKYRLGLYPSGSTKTSVNCWLLFNYGALDDNIEEYINKEINWCFYPVKGSTDYNINLKFRVLDNLGTPINQTYSISPCGSDGISSTTNFRLGDLDYNRNLSSNDAKLLNDYLLGSIQMLSNIQYKLADCNKDGLINIFDLSLLRNMISKEGTATYSELTEIDKNIYAYIKQADISEYTIEEQAELKSFANTYEKTMLYK